MAYFAVIKNKIVVNCIVADSKEFAEEITQLPCIEYTENNSPQIGITNIDTDYVDGYFYSPQIYASWTRDKGVWLPPTPKPSPDHYWDESIESWNEIPEKPEGNYHWSEATTSWVEVPAL